MKYTGEKTPIAQRRLNLRNSKVRLDGLLRANFQDGAHLLALTYRTGGRVPSDSLAALQLRDWLRAARKRGYQLSYIRATEWNNAGSGYPIHRLVVGLSGASVASLAALWEYGPVTVEPVQGDDFEALAALLMRSAMESEQRAMPCRHIWEPSVGLIRSGKEEK